MPGFAIDQAGTSEALEVIFVFTASPSDYLLQRFTQTIVLAQHPEMTAKVIPKRTSIVIRSEDFVVVEVAQPKDGADIKGD